MESPSRPERGRLCTISENDVFNAQEVTRAYVIPVVVDLHTDDPSRPSTTVFLDREVLLRAWRHCSARKHDICITSIHAICCNRGYCEVRMTAQYPAPESENQSIHVCLQTAHTSYDRARDLVTLNPHAICYLDINHLLQRARPQA